MDPLTLVTDTHTFSDEDRDSFIAGYCEALLWANTMNTDDPDDDSHSPSDWASPRPDWALQAFDPESQKRIEEVCDDFLTLAEPFLRAPHMSRDMSHHGHDLALTASGHGTGFWDRGYPSDISEALTSASKPYCAEAWFGPDGVVHFEG